MSKTQRFIITIPEIPDTDQYSTEYVRSLLVNDLRHPYDAAFDADITITPIRELDDSNPERENNGCMIYGTTNNRCDGDNHVTPHKGCILR